LINVERVRTPSTLKRPLSNYNTRNNPFSKAPTRPILAKKKAKKKAKAEALALTSVVC